MGELHHGPAKGLSRWFFTTNHKDIGTLYLWFSALMFVTGGAFAMIIRAELFQPGMQLVEPNFFNQMTTMHGLIMVFGAIMPSFVGLANWLIPMMIGAPDMALPRMNNLSFWLLPFAFAVLLSSLFVEGGNEHARAWHDLHENAIVCLDMGNHCIPIDCCNASIGRRGNHDVARYSLRYLVL